MTGMTVDYKTAVDQLDPLPWVLREIAGRWLESRAILPIDSDLVERIVKQADDCKKAELIRDQVSALIKVAAAAAVAAERLMAGRPDILDGATVEVGTDGTTTCGIEYTRSMPPGKWRRLYVPDDVADDCVKELDAFLSARTTKTDGPRLTVPFSTVFPGMTVQCPVCGHVAPTEDHQEERWPTHCGHPMWVAGP